MAFTQEEREHVQQAIIEDIPDRIRTDPEVIREKLFALAEMNDVQKDQELVRVLAVRKTRLEAILTGIDAQVARQKSAIGDQIATIGNLITKLGGTP